MKNFGNADSIIIASAHESKICHLFVELIHEISISAKMLCDFRIDFVCKTYFPSVLKFSNKTFKSSRYNILTVVGI